MRTASAGGPGGFLFLVNRFIRSSESAVITLFIRDRFNLILYFLIPFGVVFAYRLNLQKLYVAGELDILRSLIFLTEIGLVLKISSRCLSSWSLLRTEGFRRAWGPVTIAASIISLLDSLVLSIPILLLLPALSLVCLQRMTLLSLYLFLFQQFSFVLRGFIRGIPPFAILAISILILYISEVIILVFAGGRPGLEGLVDTFYLSIIIYPSKPTESLVLPIAEFGRILTLMSIMGLVALALSIQLLRRAD